MKRKEVIDRQIAQAKEQGVEVEEFEVDKLPPITVMMEAGESKIEVDDLPYAMIAYPENGHTVEVAIHAAPEGALNLALGVISAFDRIGMLEPALRLHKQVGSGELVSTSFYRLPDDGEVEDPSGGFPMEQKKESTIAPTISSLFGGRSGNWN